MKPSDCDVGILFSTFLYATALLSVSSQQRKILSICPKIDESLLLRDFVVALRTNQKTNSRGGTGSWYWDAESHLVVPAAKYSNTEIVSQQ